MTERVAIIGAGKIGEALIAGLISAGSHQPSDIVAADPRIERLAELSERYGIETNEISSTAASGAALVVIAVKPQDIGELLDEISESIDSGQLVVSVAAGITTRSIEQHLKGPVPVVRAMPNAPMTVHEGIAGVAAGAHADDHHLESAERLLQSVGSTVRVREHALDAVTAVSGSGPAYFALVAESMIEAGLLLGLARDVATDLVAHTMFGTASMLRDKGMHPVELREAVTSPGGTTIAAIHELEQAGVRAAFLNAILAASKRSEQLAAAAADND